MGVSAGREAREELWAFLTWPESWAALIEKGNPKCSCSQSWTPIVLLITLETGYGLRRGSHSPAPRGTFSKGPRHCVKSSEKPTFGKGTQLIVILGEYLHSYLM